VLLAKPVKTQYLLSQFSPLLLAANVEGDQDAICLSVIRLLIPCMVDPAVDQSLKDESFHGFCQLLRR